MTYISFEFLAFLFLCILLVPQFLKIPLSFAILIYAIPYCVIVLVSAPVPCCPQANMNSIMYISEVRCKSRLTSCEHGL